MTSTEVAEPNGEGALPEPVEKDGKDKAAHCVEMLVAGYPQAFIEFFDVTNGISKKDEEDKAEDLLDGNAKEGVVYSEEVLTLLQRSFVAVEEARRASDMDSIYESYFKVATFFLENDSPEHSIPFYTRCVGVAEEDENNQGLMKSHFQLGICYTQLENTSQAIEHHEHHLKLSLKLDDTEEEGKAYEYIIAVYNQRVTELMGQGNWEGAIEILNRLIAQAQNCGNIVAEGLANFELGNCYAKLGDHNMTLEYYTAYQDICIMCEDKIGEGKSCCALAVTYQEIGDIESAMAHLESFLELSKSGDTTSQAQACCSLGIIHFEQKKYDRAVSYFEKFFEAARTLNNSKMLDAARINLGIAKGCAKMESFFDTINDDFGRLLQWKNTRMPLPDKEII